MLTHHTVECAKSWLNPGSHCLVNGSSLLKKFVKTICLVWQVCDAPLWTLSWWCSSHICWCTLGCTVHTGWRALL